MLIQSKNNNRGLQPLKCLCDTCSNSTCIAAQKTGFCFARAKLTRDDKIDRSHGCLDQRGRGNTRAAPSLIDGSNPKSDNGDNNAVASSDDEGGILFSRMLCNSDRSNNDVLKCCHEGDYCNADKSLLPLKDDDLRRLFPRIESPQQQMNQYSATPLEFKLSFVVLSGLLLIISVALAQNRLSKRRTRRRHLETSSNSHQITQATLISPTHSDHNDHDIEASTGSGAGQPYLNQRSIAHDIELHDIIGRGYYGVVWRGYYKGEPVAVKIFAPTAEPSWERETEIYQTTMLRHKNILGFVASDKKFDSGMIGYWLVTDYYPMGSLYDFLKENSTSFQDSIRMAFSIANGLAHLHMEIFGTFGKPAIAHRDMKSKNILVKNDGTCCIADLGMAVRYISSANTVDVPTNTRVGTRRYLAPEVLENRLNLMDFDGVKATDIYALGLVFWELLRRACLVDPLNPGAVDPGLWFIPDQGSQSPSVQSIMTPCRGSTKAQQPLHSKVIEKIDERNENCSSSTVEASVSSPLLGSTAATPEAKHQETISRLSKESSGKSVITRRENDQNDKGENGKENDTVTKQSPEQYHQRPAHINLTVSGQHTSANEPNEALTVDMTNNLAVICDPYEAPYQRYVSVDPSIEEMREVVCNRKLRPPISFRWTKFAPMRDYVSLMSECWYEKPQARLSALRIRKTLGEMARHYFNLNMEYD